MIVAFLCHDNCVISLPEWTLNTNPQWLIIVAYFMSRQLCDFTARMFLRHKSTMTDYCCFFMWRQLCDFPTHVFNKHKSTMNDDCCFLSDDNCVISLPECSLNTNPKWPMIVVFLCHDNCVISLPECSLNTNPQWPMIIAFCMWRQLCDFPARVFLKHKSTMTDEFCFFYGTTIVWFPCPSVL